LAIAPLLLTYSQRVPDTLYRLEVESLDLGAGIRAVGLELLDLETREPVTGAEAARIWAAALVALSGDEPWGLDFFAHLDRVRDFCRQQNLPFREPNARVLVMASSDIIPSGQEKLAALLERFAGETFGARAGKPAITGDAAIEGGLAERGVDAYEAAFRDYLFCAVFDIENGFLTLLSERLWASEVIRRTRTLTGLHVEVTRPPE
jgi:hypothetical protein